MWEHADLEALSPLDDLQINALTARAGSGQKSCLGRRLLRAKLGRSKSGWRFARLNRFLALPTRACSSSSGPARSAWKFHLHPSLPSSSRFFHLMQLFSRESKGFVVALGFVQNKIRISSQLPPLLASDGTPLPLPEISVERYWGRTVRHQAVVTWGPAGAVECECLPSRPSDLFQILVDQSAQKCSFLQTRSAMP